MAGLAVHLEHPPVVGEQQLQGLSEEENACRPDSGGEDDHAEKCLCLWGPKVAIPFREASLDAIDQSHGDVHLAVVGTNCCHDNNQPAGGAARVHTPKDAIL